MSAPGRGFFRLRGDGIDLFVRLTPKASADAIEGIGVASDGSAHVMARVRAVPDKGLANAALRKLLATCLGIPARDLELVSGATARLKTIRINGDPARLAASAETLARPV